MSEELRGGGGLPRAPGGGAGGRGRADQRGDGRAPGRVATPAATGARSRSGSRRPWATGPALVFVDLASGSCLFAVLNRLRANARAKVVTGVNLAMLVDFVFHRTLPLDEAAARAAIAGGKAIRVP